LGIPSESENGERALVAAEWQRSWLKSKNSPLIFVRDVLGASPEPWQAEALESPRSRGTARSRVDQIWPRRRETRSVADPLVSPHAPELQDPGGSELSGPAQRQPSGPRLPSGTGHLPDALNASLDVQAERVAVVQDPEGAFAVRRSQRTTRRLSKASMPITCCSSQAGPEGHTVVKRCGTPIVYGLFRDASGNELVDDRKCRGLVTAL